MLIYFIFDLMYLEIKREFKFESSYFKFFDNEKSYPLKALMSLICLNIIEGKSYKDPLLFGKCLERQFPQLAKKFFSDTIFIN